MGTIPTVAPVVIVILTSPVDPEVPVEVRSSLRSLTLEEGSVVVRRHGKLFVINKKNPRWRARQG